MSHLTKKTIGIVLFCALCSGTLHAQDILITELLAQRTVQVLDDDGDRAEFIELYNAGTTAVDLDGYFLSDDCVERFKWSFPAGVTLRPGEFRVIWATEKDRALPSSLHANFRLEGSGECLVLSDPSGEQVHIYSPYPDQVLGYSYGLAMAGGLDREARHHFPVPTPGAENAAGAPGVTPPPVFSEPGGAYPPGLSIELTMENPVEGTEIRFTSDGKIPDPRSQVYRGPIGIDSEVALSVRAFQPGLLPSAPVTNYYVILAEDVVNFDSTIPLLICGTLGADIPKRCGIGQYTPGHFVLYNPGEDGHARFSDEPLVQHFVGYRRRGNPDFSCGRPKFFFNVEFRNHESQDQDVKFLDFTSHSDFVMWGPWEFDRTFMRNPIAYWMSREVGRYAPRTAFVETFLHRAGTELTMASYWGVYVFMERPERGRGRIEIKKLSSGDNGLPRMNGGYILKRDRIETGDTGTAAGGHANLVFTHPRVPTSRQKSFMTSYLEDMVDSLSPDIGSQEDSEFIDVMSWIDHHILNWYPKNVDAFRLSGYMFKNREGIHNMGPLWDFDRSSGCAVDPRCVTPEGFNNDAAWDSGSRYWEDPGPPGDGGRLGSWYGRLFKGGPPVGSSPWAQAYRNRWRELRTGPLSTVNISAQLDAWAAVLQEPAARNFAKWPQNLPRFGGYQGEVNHLKNWLETRGEWIDTQFVARPEFSHPGGVVERGLAVTITVERGQIFYTVDGPDPRADDGTPAAEANSYRGEELIINNNTRIRARARIGPGAWSGETTAGYLTDPTLLAVTEIMYNPPIIEGSAFSSSVYEFLEVQNVGDRPISLKGVTLDRPFFDFGAGNVQTLGEGEHLVIVRNMDAFVERYGSEGIAISGTYLGALSNSGQNIRMTGPTGEAIMDFNYKREWQPSTNRGGNSLVIRDSMAPPSSWNDASSWRPSLEIGGSPGRADEEGVELSRQGDLDGNGSLDITDAIRLLINLFGEPEQPCSTEEGNLTLQDTDGDGQLTENDVVRLLRYFFLGDEPPAMGLECTPIEGCPASCGG